MTLTYRGIPYNQNQETENTETQPDNTETPCTPADLVRQQQSSKELALTIMQDLNPEELIEVFQSTSHFLWKWHQFRASQELKAEDPDSKQLILWIGDAQKLESICSLADTL